MTETDGIFRSFEQLGPRGVERFAQSINAEWVEEALAAHGVASSRRRRLPAE